MAAKKSGQTPPENYNTYKTLIDSIKGLELKGATMPYTSLNGNMFSFLSKEGKVGIRLGKEEREDFLKKHKTTLFEAHGTVLKEYVTVPDKLLKSPKELKPYLELSLEYAKTLKPKPTKKK